MRIIHSTGQDDLATVFVVELQDGARIECVESVQPPRTRDQKWVFVVSTMRGCPVRCTFCDAGGEYRGKLSADEIIGQIRLMVARRHPDLRVPSRMLKVQFARMGEPALNDAVIEALQALPDAIQAPGLLPSVSTVAPHGRDAWFERLLAVKRRLYPGRFQLQFSLHTTDASLRRQIVPIKSWPYSTMAELGRRFVTQPGDRKVTLNFAAAQGWPIDPEALSAVFSPTHFAIKITPINPTLAADAAGLRSLTDPDDPRSAARLVRRFREQGYQTILSIGEQRENQIGSNCGMVLNSLHPPGSRAPRPTA